MENMMSDPTVESLQADLAVSRSRVNQLELDAEGHLARIESLEAQLSEVPALQERSAYLQHVVDTLTTRIEELTTMPEQPETIASEPTPQWPPEVVAAAGIRGGMSADEIEAACADAAQRLGITV